MTKAELEDKACKLYDKLNPDQFHVIRVSKSECIRRVLQAAGVTLSDLKTG